MNIEDYGFKKENYIINGAGTPARIITTYRDRYEIVCNKGKTFARLKKEAIMIIQIQYILQ